MKGYSFRSLTDLVLKIFTTKVNAGTGLSGGGSLEADRTLTVNYGTAAGTAAQGNDSRLSNSREWTAETISQAETEAGIATTRRAFTAQRVRQAIVAWFNGISGALGRTILTRTTSAQVRSDIGLGTAATKDVGEDAGQVMEVGAFGLGASGAGISITNVDDQSLRAGFYTAASTSLGVHPFPGLYGYQLIVQPFIIQPVGTYTTQIAITQVDGGLRMAIRNHRGSLPGVWSDWKELHHTGNLLQTTGSSTDFSMSQAAVTNQLATKANTSTQVIAGTGLTGGGNLSANRTLNTSYGTTAGTSVQGNDSRVVNALQRGNNLSDITNNILARSNLGLGTAAISNTVTSSFDTTAGRLMWTGYCGLGSAISGRTISNIDDLTLPNGFYTTDSTTAVRGVHPFPGLYGYQVYVNRFSDMYSTQLVITDFDGGERVAFRNSSNTGWGTWRELNHTGNTLQTTGSSTDFSMSQAAVTNAINNNSIGIIQTWQDVFSQRVFGTTYTNTTGRPIQVSIWQVSDSSPSLIVDGVTIAKVDGAPGSVGVQATAIVPQNSTYRVTAAVNGWAELR